jgi:hypothetical protein
MTGNATHIDAGEVHGMLCMHHINLQIRTDF